MKYKKIGKLKYTLPPLHKWRPSIIWTLIHYTMILIMVTIFGMYHYTSGPLDFACYVLADHRTKVM